MGLGRMPNTWSAGRVPTANDIVAIAPGTTVTYDVAASPALDSVVIYAGGVLQLRALTSALELLVTHMQVMEGGELRVGTAANPVADAVSRPRSSSATWRSTRLTIRISTATA